MHGGAGGKLQNVLSISTAANNRYLLHFSSINSLTQWTAGIRLSMFEHATLHEAYTGSLIAGKGKGLNNIRTIMTRSTMPYEDWVRVRFGAGTPWRRCWCIISPPEEKEYQKAVKTAKKGSGYARLQAPKGQIKFYDVQKVTKKTKPIATITDAYAAYAIYPQSKPLIDQSTLIKLEGLITLHPQETTSEAFIFVMPEVRAGLTGFEMLLRWLFPAYDTLVLYGRPTRLVADVRDTRGLMFAMPTDRRYGYLDDIDVSALIHTEGSQAWSERQWRLEMKKCTAHKMDVTAEAGTAKVRSSSRNSLPAMTRVGVKFQDDDFESSGPESRKPSPVPTKESTLRLPHRRTGSVESAPSSPGHNRSASDALGYKRFQPDVPTRMSQDDDSVAQPPSLSPVKGALSRKAVPRLATVNSEYEGSSEHAQNGMPITPADAPPVTPVASPPAFLHTPNARPATEPFKAPELRRATSSMDTATLLQMQEANSPANNATEPHAEHEVKDPVTSSNASTDAPEEPSGLGRGGAIPYPVVNAINVAAPVSASSTGAYAQIPLPPSATESPIKNIGIDESLVDASALDRVLATSPVNGHLPMYARPAPMPDRSIDMRQRPGRLRTTGDSSVQAAPSGPSPGHNVKDYSPVNFDNAFERERTVSRSSSGQQVPAITTDDLPQTDDDRATSLSSVSAPSLRATQSTSPLNGPPRQALSPEAWVQHRAAMAAQQGGPSVRSFSQPRSPQGRGQPLQTSLSACASPDTQMQSYEWTQRQRPSPQYRTPSNPGLLDASNRRPTVQARMQYAQASGSPLLDVQQRAPPQQGPGLYGAIQARDDYRRTNQDAYRSGPTQNAIAANQQQQVFAAQAAQTRAQYSSQQALHAAQMAQYQGHLRQQNLNQTVNNYAQGPGTANWHQQRNSPSQQATSPYSPGFRQGQPPGYAQGSSYAGYPQQTRQ